MQAPDRRLQRGLLVVDGDDDLDLRGPRVTASGGPGASERGLHAGNARTRPCERRRGPPETCLSALLRGRGRVPADRRRGGSRRAGGGARGRGRRRARVGVDEDAPRGRGAGGRDRALAARGGGDQVLEGQRLFAVEAAEVEAAAAPRPTFVPGGARGPGASARAPPRHARRGAPAVGAAPPRGRPPHGARERRRPGRRRHVRRVRRASRSRPSAAALRGGADRALAGRRHRDAAPRRVGGIACVVLAYDYTVLAGTQGLRNHRKTDRMLELAERRRLPVVLFAEGGGGRPGRHRPVRAVPACICPRSPRSRASPALVPRIGDRLRPLLRRERRAARLLRRHRRPRRTPRSAWAARR